MSGRLPALRPAEVIRVLERNGFRLLRSTKHRTYTDDGSPPQLMHRQDRNRRRLRFLVRQNTGWPHL